VAVLIRRARLGRRRSDRPLLVRCWPDHIGFSPLYALSARAAAVGLAAFLAMGRRLAHRIP
jgi:hypothetical protein